MLLFIFNPDGIAERAAVFFKMHLHPIAILKLDAFAEAEGMSAEEVHMDASGNAVPLVFEVMVLEVSNAVRHVLFACLDRLMPQREATALDADLAGDRTKLGTDNQLGTDAALAKLGAREVEIIVTLEPMV